MQLTRRSTNQKPVVQAEAAVAPWMSVSVPSQARSDALGGLLHGSAVLKHSKQKAALTLKQSH